jgi:hypothetical protein
MVEYLPSKSVPLPQLNQAIQSFRRGISFDWARSLTRQSNDTFLLDPWNILLEVPVRRCRSRDPRNYETRTTSDGTRFSHFHTVGKWRLILWMVVPDLMRNAETAELVPMEAINGIFELANPATVTNEFERKCAFLSALFEKFPEQSVYKQKVDDMLAKRSLPLHLRLSALQLSDALEELEIASGDLHSLECQKLQALATLFRRTLTMPILGRVIGIFLSRIETAPDSHAQLLDAISLVFAKVSLDSIRSDAAVIELLPDLISKNLAIQPANWSRKQLLFIVLNRFRCQISADPRSIASFRSAFLPTVSYPRP